jgi:hypothetical protein
MHFSLPLDESIHMTRYSFCYLNMCATSEWVIRDVRDGSDWTMSEFWKLEMFFCLWFLAFEKLFSILSIVSSFQNSFDLENQSSKRNLGNIHTRNNFCNVFMI